MLAGKDPSHAEVCPETLETGSLPWGLSLPHFPRIATQHGPLQWRLGFPASLWVVQDPRHSKAIFNRHPRLQGVEERGRKKIPFVYF